MNRSFNILQFLIALVLVISSIPLFAQNETNKWYFGGYAGLDFNSNPPVAITGTMTSAEGCASIADGAGNLLFYTNGEQIYDQTHSVMANGTGLSGSESTTQSALIIKQPGSPNLYYVFTLYYQAFGGLSYSIVDMNLAAGNGSVIVKNYSLTSISTEKLAGVKHCNGIDYWILTHDWNSSNFQAFLLTANGLNTVSVNSAIGAVHSSTQTNNNTAIGYMKFSPNGNKVALCTDNKLELFDFDNSNGTLSNSMLLQCPGVYGIEFSPDGSKIYGSGWIFQNNQNQYCVNQWDLCAGSTTAIAASHYSMASTVMVRALQIAIDGKIYVAASYQKTLAVINAPNLAGTACNFTQNGPVLAWLSNAASGLPNFVASDLYQKPNTSLLTFTSTVQNSCNQVNFVSPNIPLLYGCAGTGYIFNSLKWNFGDPNSGVANSSTLTNATHFYSAPGTYTTELIVFHNTCASDTIKKTVTVLGATVGISTSSITCASLGSGTISAQGGIGPFSYSWMPVGQSSAVATGLAPGNYTYSVFDSGMNCVFTNTVNFPPLIPLTADVLHTSKLPCNSVPNGTGSIVNLNGGSSKQFFQWSNSSSVFTTSNVSSLSTGIWSVTITDSLTSCKVFSVFILTQPPALTLNIVSNTNSVCLGGKISFSTQCMGGTPGFSYHWVNGPTQNNYTVTEVNPGHYTYSISATDTNSCSITNTISADFIPNPALSVSNKSICPLQSATLSASGASNYTWSTGSNQNNITDSPVTTTAYTVSGEALGCVSVATVSIILKPVPSAQATSNSPRCENEMLQLNSGGGGTYLWAGPSGYVALGQNPQINNLALVHAGVYQVTVTGANSCTSSASTSVVVNQNPTVTAVGSTVCTTQSATLSSSSIGGITYQWSGPGGFVSSQQNPAINYPSLNASGNYTVKATSAQGCTNSAIAQLLVVMPPSPTPILSSSSLCAQALNGSANTITMAALGASSYTLLTPNYVSVYPDPGAPNMTLTSVPPYNNGPSVATATLIGSNGICAVSTTATFVVIPNPTVTILTHTPQICAGQSFTYTNNGANSYTWNSGTPNYTLYNNGGVAVVHPSINAVFSVFGGSLGCNSASKTSSITVYPIPTIFISPAESKICLGTSGLLTASGTSTDFYWQPKTGLNQVNGSSVFASPLVDQTYTITGTANNCTNTAIASVSVLPLPNPVAVASKQLYCANETVTLTGTGGETYYWNGPDNLNLGGQTVSFSAFSATEGDYTLTITDKNKCVNQTKVAVKIAPLPQGSLAGSKMEACVPFCSEFEYRYPMGGKNISVNWQVENKSIAAKTFTHCFTRAGDNSVIGKFTDTLTNCVSVQTFVVKGLEVPVADFNWLPEKPIEGLEDVLFLNISSGEKQNKFNWFFINNEGYKSENENTTYFFARAGEYPVAYIVQNESGCADTVIKYITIEPDFNFYIPNSFTPNGDDRNDVFIPVMRGIKFYTLMVFDRWGEKLFETSDPNQGWDGTFKGETCKQDVYGWKVSLSTVHGESRVYSGNVTLLR